MRSAFALALLLSLALCSNVIDLDEKNFDSFISSHNYVFVKFYAPWCGHCKALAPEYEAAADQLAPEGIPMAQVDCDAHKELCERFQVSGFPTMKHFKNGSPSDYEGERKAASLVKIIRKKSGPSAKPLESVEDFDKFVANKNDVSIVGFFANKDEAKTFLATVDKMADDYRFGVCYNAEIIKAKNNGASGIVNFRPFFKEDARVAYTGSLTESSEIEKFVHTSSVPVAGLYRDEFKPRYEAIGIPRFAFIGKVDAENDPAGLRYFLNRLRKVAPEFKGKLVFTAQSKNDASVSDFGVKDGGFYIFKGKERFVGEPTEFSVDNIRAVAQAFVDGKLEPYIKSEPIPTETSTVQHVVGKNFQKEVMESDKNVFIKFYAPWCGHCKALAPKYEELAEKMKKYDNFKIVEVDATANEFPDIFTVHGYPTLYLLKADDKAHPVQYSGAREVKDMKSWLKDQVKSKKEL